MDLENKVILIQEVRTEVGGQEVVKLPKTKTSIRRLGISGSRDLLQVLTRAWEQRRTNDPDAYVLLMPDGTPPSPNYLTAALLAAVRKNRLPHITLHGLRHSFASVANHQGVTMHDISRTLGHSSIAVTSSIYTHSRLLRPAPPTSSCKTGSSRFLSPRYDKEAPHRKVRGSLFLKKERTPKRPLLFFG